jgi:hypothetical protein
VVPPTNTKIQESRCQRQDGPAETWFITRRREGTDYLIA